MPLLAPLRGPDQRARLHPWSESNRGYRPRAARAVATEKAKRCRCLKRAHSRQPGLRSRPRWAVSAPERCDPWRRVLVGERVRRRPGTRGGFARRRRRPRGLTREARSVEPLLRGPGTRTPFGRVHEARASLLPDRKRSVLRRRERRRSSSASALRRGCRRSWGFGPGSAAAWPHPSNPDHGRELDPAGQASRPAPRPVPPLRGPAPPWLRAGPEGRWSRLGSPPRRRHVRGEPAPRRFSGPAPWAACRRGWAERRVPLPEPPWGLRPASRSSWWASRISALRRRREGLRSTRPGPRLQFRSWYRRRRHGGSRPTFRPPRPRSPRDGEGWPPTPPRVEAKTESGRVPRYRRGCSHPMLGVSLRASGPGPSLRDCRARPRAAARRRPSEPRWVGPW